MPAWPRLAGSGDSRPAATQAAPTGETAGESRPAAPPFALLPSIRPLISLFLPPRPPSLAFLCRSLFSFLSSLHDDAFLSFLFIYSLSPTPSHLFNSSFMKRLERKAVDTRRIRLNTPVLSALVAGHTSVYDRLYGNCWCFDSQWDGCSVQLKREKSKLLSHSVFMLCFQAERDFVV